MPSALTAHAAGIGTRPGFDRRPPRRRALPHAMQRGAGTGEQARRRLVHVVLVIYLLAIFEGSIRKWLLPQFSQYIFFIRDPFLLYAYLLALQHGLWPRRSGWLGLSVAMGVVGLLLFVLQSAVGGFSDTRLLLGVYGWRNYFLYVPLAFLVGAQFREADLRLFIRVTLVLTVPIGLLVAAQFFSPINSPINVGIASDAELQFRGLGLTGEHTRPMGPFSSGAGQQQFVATAFALLLALLITPAATRRVRLVWLLVAAGGVLTCIALSGSRGTVLQCVLSGLFAVAVGLIGRGAALKAKAVTLPLALGVAALALYPVVFPKGFEAFMSRWTTAEKAESGFQGGVFGRALYGFVDFVRLIDVVPALGYGLGYGGNASTTLKATVDGVMPGKLAETDFARHMVDLGPLFGMGFIAVRVALTIWLTRRVLQATRLVPDPLPFLLYSYASYVLLLGQITGQGAINVYAWLFTGLCIAATRQSFQSLHAQRARLTGLASHAGLPRPSSTPRSYKP